MTKKQESGATPRQYDAAFKDEAVRMWHVADQRPIGRGDRTGTRNQCVPPL